MIGRLLRAVVGLFTEPCVPAAPPSPVAAPPPNHNVPPVQLYDGFRVLWRVQDAVVMWLSHPARINGRWTCAEIAEGINDDPVYAFEHRTKLNEASVNAAMSGISIRARGTGFCTDIDMGDGQSVHAKPEDGLKVNWKLRRWQLTPNGIGRAKTVSAANNQMSRIVDERRRSRAA